MKNDRRRFIRDVSLTATALTLTSNIRSANGSLRHEVISCGPQSLLALTGSISSIQSGNWSDTSTWSGGKIPSTGDTPLIASGHSVVFNVSSATVAGLNVAAGGNLSFDTSKSTTLQTSKNVVVQGKLEMHPSGPTVVQTLRFINITESAFVGGGMDVLDSDVGLWVMGSGMLDLLGSEKTSWTNVTGAVGQGANTIAVNAATGWKVGDAICIAPTESPSVGSAFATGFDEGTITSFSGSTITLSKGTARSHPVVNGTWKAEVMNLTRNVCIEGTPSGRAHIFIRSTSKQSVSYAALRYMGPRKDTSGDKITELVAGRYGIHFHHCMDASRDSVVEGCVVRDSGNHSYVPHVSHGIQFTDNVAYNVLETAFWYDPGDNSNDTVYDHNIVGMCNFVPASTNMNAENAPTFSSSGFSLNTGDGNVCINNVVVGGGLGDPADGGAYNWEAVINEGVWIFNNNIAHNNDCGLRVWQNSTRNHVVENFISYNNAVGLFHGAYANSYTYIGGYFYANGMQIKAASVNSNRVRVENITIDGANLADYGIQVIHSPLPGTEPVLIRNVTIKNCTAGAVLDSAAPEIHSTDIIQCNITGAIAVHQLAVDGETIRVQPTSGTPYKITKAGKVNIAAFAPTSWGSGKGLKGEYYNSANLTKLAFTRIDSNVSFSEWSTGVHYALPSTTYSIRWTGKVEAQYTEPYTIYLSSGGGHRLWVNNALVLDNWAEHYPDSYTTAPIPMEAGKQYDIKLEYFNTDANTGMGLLWSSKSQLLQYIPQSQLYSGTIAASPPPVGNKAPVANAGADITITLPVNTAKLTAAASSDPEGGVLKYAWTKVSGPAASNLATPTAVSATLTGLVEGTYVFRVVVTDDKGVTSQDDVSVIVKPAGAGNKGPSANAGGDINITLPTSSTTLNGSASVDTDGTISKYEWARVSGPVPGAITNWQSQNTTLTGLVEGVYVFRLTVTDNSGAKASDVVSVTVKAAGNGVPVANAGNDIVITAPASSVTLNASGSSDPDGTITAVKWTTVSGGGSISSPSAVSTTVTGLQPGVYVYRLTVTDDKGATDTDDVTVTVNATATDGNSVLTVTASPNPSTSYFVLKINSSNTTTQIVTSVYYLRGMLVDQFISTRGNATLTVGYTWRTGTYLVVVQQGSIRKTITLVKQ